jgi:competence protein ComEC
MEGGGEPLDNDVWETHTLDVEQADARVIITGGGNTVLVDADKKQVVEGLNTVFNGRDVERTSDGKIPLDVCIVTHIDEDHTDGLEQLREGYHVGQVVQPDSSRFDVYGPETEGQKEGVAERVLMDYKENLEELDVETITQVSSGDKVQINSDTDINVLGPPDSEDVVDVTRVSTGAEVNLPPIRSNENGAVYKLEGDRSALFMGDVQDKSDHYAESWLIQQHDDPESDVNLDADVLFVGHHGSANATSAEFLERVDPELAVISSDLGEKFDHPRDEVLENSHKHDVEVYWTAGHGSIRTDLDEALTTEQTTDLETTAAADLAALKHYCGEQEVSPEEVETLAPGNLPEETPEWITEAPMIAETSEEIADAAITNAETVEEVRQTLEDSPDAAAHLRDVVQTDRRDIVPSHEELKANRQAYKTAKKAQKWEPTLGQRLRMSLPNRFGGIDPPYQDVPVPEEIDGPQYPGDIPEAAKGNTAAEVREMSLYSPPQNLVEAEKTANRAVKTAENTSEVCQELRKTHGAHKDFLYASKTANAHEKDEGMDREATVQQGMSRDRSRDNDRGLRI